jgi:hypothetical protein
MVKQDMGSNVSGRTYQLQGSVNITPKGNNGLSITWPDKAFKQDDYKSLQEDLTNRRDFTIKDESGSVFECHPSGSTASST